jgi:hypothetical protein
MPTACSAAPLTHHAFRRRQRSVELESLSYKKLRVAWTDLGEGEPVILLHGIPTGCKASWPHPVVVVNAAPLLPAALTQMRRIRHMPRHHWLL